MATDPNTSFDPYSSPYAQFGQEPPPGAAQKQSGLGIAALVITVLCGLGMFALVVVAGVIESSQPGGMDEESPEAIAVGLGIFFLLFVAFVGFCLSIASLFHRNRGKLCGILALILNVVMVLGVVGLIVIGIAMQAGGV